MLRRLMAVVGLAGLALAGTGLPASAATAFVQNAFSAPASVAAGASFTLSANIAGRPTTKVDSAGFCVRDATGAAVALGSRPAMTVPSTSVTIRQTATLPAGAYTAVPCVRVGTTEPYTEVGASKTITVTAPRVLFSDDFSGSGAYDHTKWGEWSACTYNGSAAYGNIACGDRARLDGQGHLQIPASPTQGTSIATGARFRFTYGTVTARMMIPQQVGYWPAFWTLNSDPSGRQNAAPVGEADVMEAYTTWGDGYRRATHNYTPGGTWSAADDPLCGAGVPLRGTWHDYSAKIEPGQITFYFDGVQCGPVETRNDPESKGLPYEFGPDNTAGNWLLLTLAIGGAGGAQQPAVEDADLLVDSVTVTSL